MDGNRPSTEDPIAPHFGSNCGISVPTGGGYYSRPPAVGGGFDHQLWLPSHQPNKSTKCNGGSVKRRAKDHSTPKYLSLCDIVFTVISLSTYICVIVFDLIILHSLFQQKVALSAASQTRPMVLDPKNNQPPQLLNSQQQFSNPNDEKTVLTERSAEIFYVNVWFWIISAIIFVYFLTTQIVSLHWYNQEFQAQLPYRIVAQRANRRRSNKTMAFKINAEDSDYFSQSAPIFQQPSVKGSQSNQNSVAPIFLNTVLNQRLPIVSSNTDDAPNINNHNNNDNNITRHTGKLLNNDNVPNINDSKGKLATNNDHNNNNQVLPLSSHADRPATAKTLDARSNSNQPSRLTTRTVGMNLFHDRALIKSYLSSWQYVLDVALEFVPLIAIHILQLHVVWRHVKLFVPGGDKRKREREFGRLSVLRLYQGFLQGIPLFLIKSYFLIVHYNHRGSRLFLYSMSSRFSSISLSNQPQPAPLDPPWWAIYAGLPSSSKVSETPSVSSLIATAGFKASPLYIMIDSSLFLTSALVSLICIAWSLATFDKTILRSSNRSFTTAVKLTWPGVITRFVGEIFLFLSRALLCLMFALSCALWALVILAFHWLLMTMWLQFQSPKMAFKDKNLKDELQPQASNLYSPNKRSRSNLMESFVPLAKTEQISPNLQNHDGINYDHHAMLSRQDHKAITFSVRVKFGQKVCQVGRIGCRLCFCFINIHQQSQDQKTSMNKFYIIAYYVLVFVENTMMVTIWLHRARGPIKFRLAALLSAYGAFFLGLTFLLIFFRWFNHVTASYQSPLFYSSTQALSPLSGRHDSNLATRKNGFIPGHLYNNHIHDHRYLPLPVYINGTATGSSNSCKQLPLQRNHHHTYSTQKSHGSVERNCQRNASTTPVEDRSYSQHRALSNICKFCDGIANHATSNRQVGCEHGVKQYPLKTAVTSVSKHDRRGSYSNQQKSRHPRVLKHSSQHVINCRANATGSGTSGTNFHHAVPSDNKAVHRHCCNNNARDSKPCHDETPNLVTKSLQAEYSGPDSTGCCSCGYYRLGPSSCPIMSANNPTRYDAVHKNIYGCNESPSPRTCDHLTSEDCQLQHSYCRCCQSSTSNCCKDIQHHSINSHKRRSDPVNRLFTAFGNNFYHNNNNISKGRYSTSRNARNFTKSNKNPMEKNRDSPRKVGRCYALDPEQRLKPTTDHNYTRINDQGHKSSYYIQNNSIPINKEFNRIGSPPEAKDYFNRQNHSKARIGEYDHIKKDLSCQNQILGASHFTQTPSLPVPPSLNFNSRTHHITSDASRAPACFTTTSNYHDVKASNANGQLSTSTATSNNRQEGCAQGFISCYINPAVATGHHHRKIHGKQVDPIGYVPNEAVRLQQHGPIGKLR